MVTIIKRDGREVFCEAQKITSAISKAAHAAGEQVDSVLLTNQVMEQISDRTTVEVEEVQDLVEEALIKANYPKTAKAYILYRKERQQIREGKALIKATHNLFDSYLEDKTWQIKENANARKSINGMNNYIRERLTESYWLNNIYPESIREAHQKGVFHIHDLGFFGPYCCGWDLRQLLEMGFGGVEGKISSKPAKHLRSFLGQIVNATFTLQGECAGAQAWSSFDTYCAPFVRADGLNYRDVKQAIQEFIFNLNVPTRVGFQCPFSNLTLDITPPKTLSEQSVIIGGVLQDTCYSDYQKEMDMINKAFCEVMEEGDASSRVFTFPVPTYNITKDFPWDSEVTDAIFSMTAKYGIPYFSNYINSDLSPEDALSMCCRLRLDTTELRKRGGGLFGSNPLTGSIGVVTINLSRLAYESSNEDEFREKLLSAALLAKESLEIKRKVVEGEMERGMYPFSKVFLSDIKEKQGAYWANHFSTIGVVGMEEACANLLNTSLLEEEGQNFGLRTLTYLREIIQDFQKTSDGVLYNLEATPAEGASYRLANLDKKVYPDIITAGHKEHYYTNSSQLPVSSTKDIFEVLEKQDELQCQYTGGTVLHLYLDQSIKDSSLAKLLIKRIFTKYKLPYLSLTPTFSTCEDHGYLNGEQKNCPHCGKTTEVWTRVVGYLRPVADFHPGKQEEHSERTFFKAEAV